MQPVCDTYNGLQFLLSEPYKLPKSCGWGMGMYLIPEILDDLRGLQDRALKKHGSLS